MIDAPLPFSIDLKAGEPVFQQVVYAVEKAVVAGTLRPGDRFPSVRRLSQALKINPNTAHKIVAALKADGLLVVYPGIGTVVAEREVPDDAETAARSLDDPIERLVVEARRRGVDRETVVARIETHWRRLEGRGNPSTEGEES